MTSWEDREELGDLEGQQGERYKRLWVENKRLKKQMDVLRLEMTEKDRIIKELKVQIDSSILEDTKNRIQFVRIVEAEVESKTIEAKEEYLKKMSESELLIEEQLATRIKVEKELQFEKEQNRKLATKVRDLKDHIIVALDEKDLIINELMKLVSSGQQIKYANRQYAYHNPAFEEYSIKEEKIINEGKQPLEKKNKKVFIRRNV